MTDLWDFAYQDLSDAEADVYEAIERNGQAIADVAAETDREPTTVRTLLHRARRKRGEAPHVN